MDKTTIIIVIIGALCFIAFGVVVYLLLSSKKKDNIQNLMQASKIGRAGYVRGIKPDFADEDTAKIQKITETKRKEYKKKKEKISDEDRLYHAGLLTTELREKFKRFRIILPVAFVLFGGIGGGVLAGAKGASLLAASGGIAGYILPSFILDSKIRRRGDEIMYYLPLVIEQIAIGVSSSLDIGPCLQRIVQMADERDTHNVVTELIYHAERYIRSGVSLEDAMTEIGIKSGHTELKHAFMALGQVAKHGGEITHQLHELGNAVSSQRETMIEAKIKKLELKATGPVALVFAGFMATLMAGLMVRLKSMF